MRVFEKIRIQNRQKIKIRQFRLFNIPIFQYEISHEKKLKIVFPLFRKLKSKDNIFYLKVNSTNKAYVFNCISHWLEIINAIGGGERTDYYFICDNPNLEREIITQLVFPNGNVKFLRSNYRIPKRYLKVTTNPRWRKAGYAHLTTFWHAKKNGIKSFWNIDADDTMFMETPENVAKCLKCAEKIAEENDIFCFSSDMHQSRYWGLWTFGVTYTRMNTDIFKILKNTKDFSWKEPFKKRFPAANIDNFFCAVGNSDLAKITGFNFDNLYFMHYGTFGIGNGYRALQIERHGKLYFPIGMDIFKDDKYSIISTDKNVINIDAGIVEENSFLYMKNMNFDYVKDNTISAWGREYYEGD